MSGYYYLAASLPSFDLGDPPPVTPEEFAFSCTGVLSDADRTELDALVRGDLAELTSPFGRAWCGIDTQLRNAAARLRAARSGADAGSAIRNHEGFSAWLEQAVASAFGKATPLERERALDECRWAAAEDLAHDDAFGLPAVLAFVVRLQLTQRWAAIQEEAGAARVEEIIDRNIQQSSATDEDQEGALHEA